MAESQQETQKKSESSDTGLKPLDNEALSPEIVAVESRPEELDNLKVAEPEISETDLDDAVKAADETDLDAIPEDTPDTQPLGEADRNKKPPHFWRRRKFWFRLFFLAIVAGAIAWFIQPSRIWLVNFVGLRATLVMNTATLAGGDQPSSVLKNVDISVGDSKWNSDGQGNVTAKVPYGYWDVVATKQGYQQAVHSLAVDFDPFFYLLGGRQQDQTSRSFTLLLKAVGLPVAFTAKDWLSGNQITSGAFSVGEIVARPNDQGVVSFTLPATDAKKINVKATFGGGYADKTFDLPLDNSKPTITFVPEGRHYFISSREGSPAVYSSDVDGGNMSKILPSAGQETAAMSITVSPSGKFAVLASTRDGAHDEQGVLLQKLYIINLTSQTMTNFDEGQWFNFVDWSGDTLVYTVGEHKPGASTLTQRLSSVDVSATRRADITSAGSLGVVRVALGSIVYQITVEATDPTISNSPEVRVAPIRGGGQKNLGNHVQAISQSDEANFVFQSGDGMWHGYNVNTSQSAPASAPTDTNRAILATISEDGQNRLVVTTTDGKPTIRVRGVATGEEKTLYSATEIRGPIHFVGNTIVFRMSDGGQTSDYALSVSGGAPKKITDVTATITPFARPANYLTFF